MWIAPLEYMHIRVYYNPHSDTRNEYSTRVNVNAALGSEYINKHKFKHKFKTLLALDFTMIFHQ